MMLRKAPRLLSVALLATALVAACDDDDGDDMIAPEEPGTVAEIAAGSDDFETLEAALTAAGLTATLDGTGPFTVFAPTDAAFEALPAGTLDDLLLPENQDQLPASRRDGPAARRYFPPDFESPRRDAVVPALAEA